MCNHLTCMYIYVYLYIYTSPRVVRPQSLILETVGTMPQACHGMPNSIVCQGMPWHMPSMSGCPGICWDMVIWGASHGRSGHTMAYGMAYVGECRGVCLGICHGMRFGMPWHAQAWHQQFLVNLEIRPSGAKQFMMLPDITLCGRLRSRCSDRWLLSPSRDKTKTIQSPNILDESLTHSRKVAAQAD